MATRTTTAYERHLPSPAAVDHALAGSAETVYWLEDAGSEVTYPQLTRSGSAEFTIVGGGYLGLWTAVLAKIRNPGLRVMVLESQTLGWAASGRNGGFCEATLTHGEANGVARWPEEYDTLARLGLENLEAMEQDVTRFALDCHWERTGVLRVAVEEHQVDWLASHSGFLDREEVRGEVDSPLFLAGAWDKHDAALVQPVRLARELGRVAADLGVEIFEHTHVTGITTATRGPLTVRTARGTITTERVALATNVFPSLLRRNRLMTVPVYDFVLATEPLSPGQLEAVGWRHRQGLADLANQFHYFRLTADNRIVYGGYDAVYHAGRKVRPEYEKRPATHRRLTSHLLSTFPQLEGIKVTHRWAGAIDTCTQFAAFHGLAHGGRIAYAAGFTGLGVGATRFAAEVMLDRLEGLDTERTRLKMVRRRPLPFPPEPVASIGINLTRTALDRADHRAGRRGPFLRTLDAFGLGFDS
ncbi:NAD(P)/FAD-dependent oxidoreductase [Streptomyces canus]|uniref:NAD(P)/FAD-dependent oxidoreductase n=1 Tax=Streptomyces canus TaxID=58343 RepID=UPI0037FEFE84